MACTNAARNYRSSYVIIRSNNHEIEVPLYQGDFSASELRHNQREAVAYTAQGDVHTVLEGARVNPTGSFTAHFAGYSSTTAKRLIDMIERRGYFAASERVPHVCGDAYLLDVVHVVRASGDEPEQERIYRSCALTAEYSSGDPDSVSVSWECFGSVDTY